MSNISKDKLELIQKSGLDKHYTADSWDEYNKQMFDELACKYDLGNMIQTFASKKRLDQRFIQNIPTPQNAKILDLCTGTGDIAIALAKSFPDANITGVDASPNMLQLAKQKAKEFNNIVFLECNALQLPFANEQFDIVVCSFGLRNLANLKQGIQEMIRVVKPKGFVSSIDQGKPQNRLINIFYKLYFFKVTPLIGKLFFNKDEYNSFRYLPESNNYFPSPAELISLFKKAGLDEMKDYDFFMGAINQQVGQKK